MDQKLKVLHDVETCISLAVALSALLCEMIDDGGTAPDKAAHAVRVLGLLQDRLDAAREAAIPAQA